MFVAGAKVVESTATDHAGNCAGPGRHRLTEQVELGRGIRQAHVGGRGCSLGQRRVQIENRTGASAVTLAQQASIQGQKVCLHLVACLPADTRCGTQAS